MAFNKKKAFSDNLNAIEEIFNAHLEKRQPNHLIIKNFIGYGGLKEVLLDPERSDNWKKSNQKYADDIKKLHTVINKGYQNHPIKAKEMLNSLKNSVLTSFYTNPDLIESIISPLKNVLPDNPIVLEPSCGTGNYLNVLENILPNSKITGVEKEKLSGFIAKKAYPNTNILIGGFETVSDNENKYDLVISNIPFGDFKVYDKAFNKYKKNDVNFTSQNKIHNYFFIKGMQSLKANGVMAFITSTGVMDSKTSQDIRKELMLQAKLITAFRLPNITFKDDSGTEVNSDLILLKKRIQPLNSIEELDVTEKDFIKINKENDNQINQYYTKNPEQVLGQFEEGFLHDRKTIIVAPNSQYPTNESVNQFIKKTISDSFVTKDKTLDKPIKEEVSKTEVIQQNLGQLDLFSQVEISPTEPHTNSKIENQTINEVLDYSFTEEELNRYSLGNIVIKHDKYGVYTIDENGEPIIKEILHKNIDLEKAKSFVEIREAYKSLIDSEFNSETGYLKQKREALNIAYDSFNQKYGNLHSRNNVALSHFDIESFKILSIENRDKDLKWVKGDIFGKATVIPKIDTNIKTLEEGILKSINTYGKLDFTYIGRLLNEDPNEIIKIGIAKELLYPNPIFDKDFNHTQIKNNNLNELKFDFSTKDEFLSGPIASKISVLEVFKEKLYQDDEKLYTKHIGLLEDIRPTTINIEDIQPKLGEYWINDKVFSDFAKEHFKTDCKVTRNMDNWLIQAGESNVINDYYHYKQISNRNITGITILDHALKGTTHTSTYSVEIGDKKITKIDTKAITFANIKTKEMNDKFLHFVLNDKVLSKQLETKYNSLFNLNVKREITPEILEFSDMKYFVPRKHQVNAIYRNIINNGGINDHMVGAGKTLVIIGTAKKLKQLNIAKKPLILGLKANSQELYKDFMLAYPDSKVLYPGKADFSPQKRKEFLHRVINNDWDAIIMTHDQFKTVPQDPEITQNIIEQELQDCRSNLESLVGNDEATKRQKKGLEKRIANLEVNLQRSFDTQKKDDIGINFKNLGIDHILIDESHTYKNLQYNTRHSRVSGLSDANGSQIANDMLIAIRTLQQRYGADKGATFLSGTTLSNSVVEMYALMKYLRPSELEKRGLTNFDSWARTFAEVSVEFEINVTNEVKPKSRFRSFTKAPELASMYAEIADVINDDNLKLDKPEMVQNLVYIEPTDFQKKFNKDLVECVKTDDFSSIGLELTEKQLKAKMLLATGLSSKMSLDTRLVYPNNHISEGSKLHKLCETISNEHIQSNEYKGTQFVFCDIGVPGTKNAAEFLDVYQSIKDNLVIGYGFKEEEIQFIHDYDKQTERSKLFDKVNKGEVRVMIGSTKKMGTGVNMQKRCVAMHHLDIPWTPKDIDQRNGRGIRQGNTIAKEFNNNKVNVYTYATRMSLDAYKYFLVETKRNFINQIKNNTVSVRTINEDDADGSSMSKADFIAELSGKKELIQKMKIDKKIDFLLDKKTMLDRNRSNAIAEKILATESIPKLKNHLIALEKDKLQRDELFSMSIKEQKQVPCLTINGVNYDDGKVIGEKIIEMQKKFLKVTSDNVGEFEFGNLGDFKLIMEYSKVSTGSDMFTTSHELKLINDNSPIRYSHGSKIISETPGTTGRYVLDCLNKIEHLAESQTEQISRMEKKIESCDMVLLDKALDTTIMDKEILELRAESLRLKEILENGEEKEVVKEKRMEM